MQASVVSGVLCVLGVLVCGVPSRASALRRAPRWPTPVRPIGRALSSLRYRLAPGLTDLGRHYRDKRLAVWSLASLTLHPLLTEGTRRKLTR